MAYLRFNYRSEALGKYIDVSVVLPMENYSYYKEGSGFQPRIHLGPNTKPMYHDGMKFQTVYLIHGGGDDDSLPYRYTSIERYAVANNVMLVTPDISNSFGSDTEYGVDYSLFLTEELPVVIQSMFPSSHAREDNYIIGFAMGGNAALHAAMRRPSRYAVCIDMSGGIGYTLDIEQFKAEINGEHFSKDFYLHNATFGPADKIDGSRHDLRYMAKDLLESGLPAPKFYVLAGSEEGFIGARVKRDAQLLKEMGFDVTYVEEPGGKHDFDLWDKYLRIALSEWLPLKRDPAAI